MSTLAPPTPAGPAHDRDQSGRSLRRLVPGLGVIASYRRKWLAKDIIAGVVLTTLLVPQGMAYAELAGLPPITGLYTSIMCLLGYAVLGPSRILVLGPDSSLGPMIAATILPLAGAGGDPKRAIALASMLAILVAAIMIVAAVAKLGFIAQLISKPTMIGYMNGLALTILVGQLPKLFGFKVDADIPGTVRLWRQRKAEFLLSIAAFLGVALLGVLPGIAIAVALSILNVFRRAWWPYDTELGRVEGLEGYHDVHTHPDAEQLPGLVIYRFDAPLFFANATTFRDEVRRLASAEPKPTWIMIAAEPVTDVDTTASDVLEDLDEALNAQGISLVFAELKGPVREKIERYGLTRTIDPRHFFPTVESAVAAFRQMTGAEWTAVGQATDDGTRPG
jgi:MFS superfamily sulfate permease-like transporter